MTPSSPFHPPGNQPLSFISYANNPGVIGEAPGSRRQTSEPAPNSSGNGEILLQLLQGAGGGSTSNSSGFNSNTNLPADARYLPSAPQPQQRHGILPADDAASATWLLDPALAALGPSHSFRHQLLLQPGPGPAPDRQLLKQGGAGEGQMQQPSLSNQPNTAWSCHPFAPRQDPAFPPAPVASRYVQGASGQQQQPAAPPWRGGSWAGAPRQPHPQFYGNGAELLQLLLGNTQAAVSASPSQRGLDGDAGKAGQPKAAPLLPIGPPKKNDPPASLAPDELLGRFWAASRTSSNAAHESGLEDQLGNEPSLDMSVLMQAGQLDRRMHHVPGPPDLSPGLPESDTSAFPFPSALASEAVDSQAAARAYIQGWPAVEDARMGMSSDRQRNGFSQLQRVIGSSAANLGLQGRIRDDVYSTSSRSMDAFAESHDNQCKDQFDAMEFPREFVRDVSRSGRRGASSSVGRGDTSRRGGRSVTGQWVVVNDRQREKEVENVHSAMGSFREHLEGMDKASYMVTKDESKLRIDDGTPQKIRDEVKRRKGQQQEWRMKQPAQTSMLRHGTDSQSVESTAKDVDSRDGSLAPPFLAPSLASQLENPGLPVSILSASSPGSSVDEPSLHVHEAEDRGRENGSRTLAPENDDALGKKEEEELLRGLGCLDLLDDHESSQHRDGEQFMGVKVSGFERHQDQFASSHQLQRAKTRADSHHRPDMEKITPQLLSIYDSLIPLEEEESRRRQFLSHLDNLVAGEWPGARLFLFGSCANAFGVCNSDVDICLSVNDDQSSKADLVVRMASILRMHNMQNVQALTHARVPIVKFTEPVTGISCDICVNNMLAVVNSKLLHDYSKVDIRLRQLAFIVKHWAKRRQVNETYRGTLSSYAYVLMCIHFLQQRKPAILPCLQKGMPATYQVKIGRIECAYFDKVETLTNFGSQNKDTLGELVTAFFEYWAFRHDYNRAVISIRTGTFLSKDQKDWTRRIGNERHLICIEDPFETTHDLGRVVDRHSIRTLRDEFYRAAQIMRHDPNSCVTLFEPFIREK